MQNQICPLFHLKDRIYAETVIAPLQLQEKLCKN